MTELHAPVRLDGRYELGALLGAGGTAQVHRGVDLVLARPVAIKVFRTDVELHDEARIGAEGRTLAALNHPGLVAVYDAGTAQTPSGLARYLVMELVEGPSLATAAYDGSLTPGDLVRAGAELGDALAYVHAHGTVHRDVKPANILLSRDGRAKITDFGIARLVDSARLTATGLTIGTAAYLSPEQLTSAEVGPPSDVYSLGLVLLECLTGRREYPGTGVESALARLHRSPDIPVSLAAPWPTLLAAMTDGDPTRRPTAAEVAEALRPGPYGVSVRAGQDDISTTGRTEVLPVADTRGTAATAVEPTPTIALSGETGSPRGRGRHRGRALTATVAVLIAVGAALTVLLLTRGGHPTQPPSTSPTSQTSGSTLTRDVNDLNKAVTP